jgi:hypothetical protein
MILRESQAQKSSTKIFQNKFDKPVENCMIPLDMKTQLNASPIFTQGISPSDVSSMDMDLEGMKQACQIFRDNIYSNKIRAVVREWTCNAIDEHKKYQIDKPVIVSIGNGKFSVRDFAAGLNDDNIRNVFGKYFRSTKSNSNQQIGGFGVGAKAGHCYKDTFYVTSFFNGTKTIYCCVLAGDETGASIGQVVTMGCEPTKETGLLIEIEVDSHDIPEFLQESVSAARNTTLSKVDVYKDSKKIVIPQKTLIVAKDNVKIFQIDDESRDCFVTMGGVYYDLPEGVSIFKNYDGVRPKKCIQIDVPVGFFDIPISRENFRKNSKFDSNLAQCNRLLFELIKQQAAKISNFGLSFYLNPNNLDCSDIFTFKPIYFVGEAIAKHILNISLAGDDSHSQMMRKGKVLVCIVSNHKAHSTKQLSKMNDVLSNQKHKIFYIAENKAQNFLSFAANHNVDHNLIFAKFNSCFPTPKAGGATFTTDKYKVSKCGYPSNNQTLYLNALELHNLIFNSQCQTHEEAKAEIAAAKTKIQELQQLNRLTVSVGVGIYKKFKFASRTLANNLLALGYFDRDSLKYKIISGQLIEKTRKDLESSTKISETSKSLTPFISPKTRNIIEKARRLPFEKGSQYLKRIDQMTTVINKAVAKAEQKNAIASIFLDHCIQTNKYVYTFPARKDIRLVLKTVFSS